MLHIGTPLWGQSISIMYSRYDKGLLRWTLYQDKNTKQSHYKDVIMGAIASQITSLTIVYPIVHSDAHQRKHQSSASLVFVLRIHRGPVNSPHKWPVTRKMFAFDDVIVACQNSGPLSWYLVATSGVRIVWSLRIFKGVPVALLPQRACQI